MGNNKLQLVGNGEDTSLHFTRKDASTSVPAIPYIRGTFALPPQWGGDAKSGLCSPPLQMAFMNPRATYENSHLRVGCGMNDLWTGVRTIL
jgi:hypothetical protein